MADNDVKQAGRSMRNRIQEHRRNPGLILAGALVLAVGLALIIQNWRGLGLDSSSFLVLLFLLEALPGLAGKP